MVRPSTRHPRIGASTALRRFIASDVRVGLLLAISWQLLMTIVGLCIALQGGDTSITSAFTSHMNHWDAGWYHHIITYNYGPTGSPAAPAFYPLFPSLVALTSFVSFGLLSHEWAALLVNTLALWAALVALLRILRHFHTGRGAQVTGIALFLCLPSAFFMHVFYGEAVFVAIGFWAYLSALQRRWWRVGILLAVLSAARLPALLFVILCAIEYLRAYSWNLTRAWNKQALWIALTPVGFLVYGGYLALIRHDFLAMFHAYAATNDWTYQVFSPNIFATLTSEVSVVVHAGLQGSLTYEVFVNHALPLGTLALLVAASIYCLRLPNRIGWPLGIFGLASSLMFTLNSNLVSVHRYILPCVVIYVAAAGWYRAHAARRVLLACALVACLLVQFFLYAKFLHDVFAG